MSPSLELNRNPTTSVSPPVVAGTVGSILRHIDENAVCYAAAPLFEHMRDPNVSAAERLSFVPYVAHFVMTFADLYALVLREEPARDRFQALVNTHTDEDGGHWKWYLADLPKTGYDATIALSEALRFLWGEQTKQQRLLSYHICRLGFGADSLQKLILAQCIESTGKVTLQATVAVEQQIERATPRKLVYFGDHHLATESSHALEDAGVRAELETVSVEPDRHARLCAMADEVFGYFRSFTDEALTYMTSGRRFG